MGITTGTRGPDFTSFPDEQDDVLDRSECRSSVDNAKRVTGGHIAGGDTGG